MMIEFPPYRLDRHAQRLWRGEQVVALRPKTWALLEYLAERPGVLVQKEELVEAIWGQVALSDDAITRTVAELRYALDDDARKPGIIQTVHRRGFRFIAQLAEPTGATRAGSAALPAMSPGREPTDSELKAPFLVGRDSELSTLQAAFRRAAAGARQLVFVTGEPGIGKTGIVNEFIRELRAADPRLRVGWGQCLEQYGGRESYMPVLEALERLGRRNAAKDGAPLLRAIAPTWLLQMPSLQTLDDADVLARIAPATTPQRMLREFASFTEAVSASEPILLVFEDLHWSDCATVDLLSMLAQRKERARLLIVATFRPAEAVALGHPITHAAATLQGHHLCTHIPLAGLTRDAVDEYLRVRLGPSRVADEVAALVHDQTDGNPLFMTALVSELLGRGWLIQQEEWTLVADRAEIAKNAPDDLVRALEGQLRLMQVAERDLLDVASVAGERFDAQLLAAGLEQNLEDVEALCHQIHRAGGLFRYLGTRDWPDGSVGGRYAFVHAAYQRVLYELIPPFRRRILHHRLGERLAAGFTGATRTVAGELAVHFQRCNDERRALTYLTESATYAYERRACGDVIACAETALQIARNLPKTPELVRWELELRQMYGAALSYAQGYTGAALKENLVCALGLARQADDRLAIFEMLYALEMLYSARGESVAAVASCREMLALSEGHRPWVRRAEFAWGRQALWMGDLATAQRCFRNVRLDTTPENGAPWFGVEANIGAASHESLRLWVAGDADRALSLQQETIELAEHFGHPLTLVQAVTFGAVISSLCNHWPKAVDLASRSLATSTEIGFELWKAIASVCRGRALVGEGHTEPGLREMGDGLAALRATGFRRAGTLLMTFQAGAHLAVEDWRGGLSIVKQGVELCRETGERLLEAELWRLRGELLLLGARAKSLEAPQPNRIAAAQKYFETAIAIAQLQGARTLQHRAEKSLTHLRRSGSAPRHAPRIGVGSQDSLRFARNRGA
jgi:DNA-binding winged helix-turn-helix (wHTH) protein